MTTEELNDKLSSIESMGEAAKFLKKEFGNFVTVNQFTGKARYMVAKLIEYSYLLYKERDVYFVCINVGQLNELKNQFLHAPSGVSLSTNNNQYGSKKEIS